MLRSMANALQPVIHIGKEGVNDNLVKQTWDALEARELIKITVQRNAPYENAREACDVLCERVHAEPVQVIGNRFVIYRRARKDSQIDVDQLVLSLIFTAVYPVRQPVDVSTTQHVAKTELTPHKR